MADDVRRRALGEGLTEVVMSMLPLVVLSFTLLHLGQGRKVLEKPEWAVGASIFFGQSIVRLVSALTARHAPLRASNVALFAASLLVFGLVPALMALVFVLITLPPDHVSPWLQWTQLALFIGSALSHVVVGVLSHELAAQP